MGSVCVGGGGGGGLLLRRMFEPDLNKTSGLLLISVKCISVIEKFGSVGPGIFVVSIKITYLVLFLALILMVIRRSGLSNIFCSRNDDIQGKPFLLCIVHYRLIDRFKEMCIYGSIDVQKYYFNRETSILAQTIKTIG